MKPSKHDIKGANEDDCFLFCAHTLCMNYVINTFLLASSSVRSKNLLCFVHWVKVKKENKSIQQRTLSSFITISLNGTKPSSIQFFAKIRMFFMTH